MQINIDYFLSLDEGGKSVAFNSFYSLCPLYFVEYDQE